MMARFVYIHGSLHSVVHSDAEAWAIIRRFPLGTLYEVRDAAGQPIDEFEPF
ncbi:BcepNY3gp57 [Burkholderia phage BcepNY3]|uniref:Gp58 n=4 Tax=Naesvirus TaxID=2733115 RepID=Q6UIX3_9CAUD|nr:gp56 [Burkholderia phage Bcep781]NP_944367.1 gp58 [Burkholderia phage Bcep1]NP_958162.1 gp55 [Burkholderia phage Bcep43]YP_001294895.1 BcepNY3gp57 [Burkholderia phage BcepNY3]AAN38055.2 gp56 [Burkholderia phage Bcep781]AAQ73405.1 gp58 [Burkholderia phage Bcep1]AAR89348.1 gp55 [Burkholderia phage Bcep43]ABR10592.1 BcepNY3gp57 [Burkholderia phage BcepNY3]